MVEQETRDLAPVINAPPTPIQVVPVRGMIEAMKAYRELQAGLDKAMPDQLITIGGKPFRCKGYWRAVARSFHLAVTAVHEETVERDGDWGYLITCRATYRRTDGAEVSVDGDGACFASEKTKGRMAATVHNVRAHAHTRAFNRAVSNCVGFGEVSAEEVGPDEGETIDVVPGKTGTVNGKNALRAGREKAIEETRTKAGWTNADVATLIIEIAGKHVLADALTAEQFQAVLTRIREAK